MEYTKTHLNYLEQVQLLRSRGMDVGETPAAVEALKRIGYYRLSAYTYPMRQPLAVPDATHHRSDIFVTGARLDHAVSLHDFDHRLRRTLLPAIQTLEVGLRTRVAYHLGRRNAMGHLQEDDLDHYECTKLASGPDVHDTKYSSWRREYDSLQAKASGEEYVRHFHWKYDGKVPIWAACEFMTMGCLIGLYRLLQPQDAGRIAHELGVKNKDVLFGWLKALNVERNHCAHNSRLWNRSTIYPPDKINARMVEPELHHLIDADRNKVYFLSAVLAYLLRRIEKSSRFPSDFRTVMNKFPTIPALTPEVSMGFVPTWKSEALWAL